MRFPCANSSRVKLFGCIFGKSVWEQQNTAHGPAARPDANTDRTRSCYLCSTFFLDTSSDIINMLYTYIYHVLRLLRGMHCATHTHSCTHTHTHTHRGSCTASEKHHSFEVKKDNPNIPGMNLGEDEADVWQKKKKKRKKKRFFLKKKKKEKRRFK